MFRGFKYKPVKEVKSEMIGDVSDVNTLLGFLFNIMSNRDTAIYEWIINWLSHLFQRPDELPVTAPFPVSEEGCGKGLFWQNFIGELCVGRRYAVLDGDIDQIGGRFNGFLS